MTDDDIRGALQVVEILASPDGKSVALLMPNGHPVDPCPWLVVTPAEVAGAEGYGWVADDYVCGWYVVDHGGWP